MSIKNPASADTPGSPAKLQGEVHSALSRAHFQERVEAVLLGSKKSTGADGVAVSLKEGDLYLCRASVGLAPEIGVAVEPGQGICGRCVSESKAVMEQELAGDIQSVIAVPVMKDGVVHGFVAGFSIQRMAFPPGAVKDFHRLAAVIQHELEPTLSVVPKPSHDEAGEDILPDVEINAPLLSEPGVEDFVEEDELGLSDLVRDVLKDPPAQTPKVGVPHEPVAPSFQKRTTEEVLMQIVEHSPKPAQTAVAAAAPAIAPVPTAKPVPEAKPETKRTAEVHVKVAPTPKKPVAAVEVHPPRTEKKPSAIDHTERPVEIDWDGNTRVIVMAIIAIVLIALLAYFFYFRQRSRQPQKVSAAPAAQTAPAAAPTSTAPTPTVPEVHQATKAAAPEGEKVAPKEQRKAPIVVAGSSVPRSAIAADEPPPVALGGATSGIAAPVIPTRTGNIVFGGERSTGATPAKLLQRVDPIFPPMARSMHMSGDVKLEAQVGTDGRVKNVRTINGTSVLAVAAADAVRKWRYEPAKQNGKSVESVVEVTIRFR